MSELPTQDATEIAAIVDALAATWNAADADGFARPFTDDASFVDIMALMDRGRPAIRERHEWLFRGPFQDSRVAYEVLDVQTIAPGVALAHVTAALDTASGRIDTLASCVFVHRDGQWQLAVFHNTRIGHY